MYEEDAKEQLKIKLKIRADKRREYQKRFDDVKKELKCPLKLKSIEASTSLDIQAVNFFHSLFFFIFMFLVYGLGEVTSLQGDFSLQCKSNLIG